MRWVGIAGQIGGCAGHCKASVTVSGFGEVGAFCGFLLLWGARRLYGVWSSSLHSGAGCEQSGSTAQKHRRLYWI